MHRKSLALVAIAVTLLSILLLQMTVAQAAAPQQAAVQEPADEPQPIDPPIRIRIRQSIPLTISLLPASEVTGVLTATTLTATAELTGSAGIAAASELTESATITDATTATADASDTADAAASEELTATTALTEPVISNSVLVTLEIELDFVVTQTLTTTIPSSVTVEVADAQTVTLPIEVVVAPTAEGDAVVDLILPAIETETPEVEPAADITVTEAVTPTATDVTTETAPVETETVTTPLPAEINGVPLINATVTVTSNLRAEPTTESEVVTQVGPGATVQIAAISQDGQWYLLSNGAWIATFLVAEQPADVPTITDAILQAVQGGQPTPAAEPTEAAAPVEPPATTIVTPTVTVDANLRSGPGTEFDVIGGTITGQEVNIVGRNADGTWFRLDNGGWVLGTLVANPPALDTVPVVNNDGTPAAAAATPTPDTVTGGLGGLLPTPTPIPPQTGTQTETQTADLAAYLTSASELVSQFDVVLNSVDALIAEASANSALLSDSGWTTRMNAALTLLRRTSASVGELQAPGGAEELQQLLETAALSYNEAAQALASAVQARDMTLFNEADALVSAATANLTAAETAIATQGQ